MNFTPKSIFVKGKFKIKFVGGEQGRVQIKESKNTNTINRSVFYYQSREKVIFLFCFKILNIDKV